MFVMDLIVVVMVMMVVMMAVAVAVIVVMRGGRQHGGRLRRLQRAHEGAALGPDQPEAEGGDQAVAGDLDRLFGPAHGFGGGVEQPGAYRDDHNRDQRLHQRRGKRQRDAAPRGLLVGDQIRRDHRLAVAGAGGMKNPIGKRDRQQGPDGAAVRLRGANGRGHLAVEFGLLCQQPSNEAADLRLGAARARAAERTLRQQDMRDAVERNHDQNGGGADRHAARDAAAEKMPHGQSTVILLANIAP